MDYQLVIVRGRSGAQTINLLDGVTTVGRQDDCHLRIRSSQVSRRHCELFEKKGHLVVKDLGSSNGTYVNGEKVKEQRVLELGDELTIGQVKLRVTKIGETSVPSSPRQTAKPGDTAVVQPVSSGESDDEFEIEFDDEPSETAPVPIAEMDDVEPATAVPTQAKSQAEEPKGKGKSEEALAEDAVADFLLDIKLDEEE
jgi:pSer/pThr/pTyr-binding forkhead associated (FHA) protein